MNVTEYIKDINISKDEPKEPIRRPAEHEAAWIRLNVGGKIFTTTRQTLTRDCPSFLQKLCEDGSMTSHKDDSGAYLIDRDPEYFGPVLNYLRHGKLVINPGISEEGVLEEAEFYNLPTLSTMINERIQERKKIICDAACEKAVRSVYRVLQCHQDELTNVVSAMGDGWKIVQVLPNGHFNFSADGQQEYLCIVVRDFPETNPVENVNTDRAQHIQQRSRSQSASHFT
ncbi:unnamed protein product [Auanema sp. JU1783]|nr:unnamed protein product [Auanema sp. JU1783]